MIPSPGFYVGPPLVCESVIFGHSQNINYVEVIKSCITNKNTINQVDAVKCWSQTSACMTSHISLCNDERISRIDWILLTLKRGSDKCYSIKEFVLSIMA